MNSQEEQLRKQSHLLLQQQKNKVPRNKLAKEIKYLYYEFYKILKQEIKDNTYLQFRDF